MHRNCYRLGLSALLLASGLPQGEAGVIFSRPVKPSTAGIVQNKPVGNVPTQVHAKASTMPPPPARKQGTKHTHTPPTPPEASTRADRPAPTNPPTLAATIRVVPKPGTKPDPAKAEGERQRLSKNLLEWQQSLVEKGSSRAQYDMGVRYLTGDAVPQDKAKGVELLKKAAAGGETLANRKLKELGEAVPEISATETP